MFEQSSIAGISLKPSGANVAISWTSAAPAGSTYQVYGDGVLIYHGTALGATVPVASWYDVGTVASTESTTDFSAYLPPRPRSRALLKWLGGTFQAADLQGFRVFGETTPGGGIDYTTPLADLEAYVSGAVSDGYGLGGYGLGGYGAAAATYTWESGPYRPSGTWHFGVTSYDSVGNLGASAVFAVALTARPAEVPYRASGSRIDYTYSQSTGEITLNWSASTG